MIVLENILSQEIVQRLGWTLLHFVWQAAAVALLLAIVLQVLRKYSANLRYIIACSALALVVLLPVITIQLVPVSVSYSEQKTEFRRQKAEGGLKKVEAQSSVLSPQSSILEKPARLERLATPTWKQWSSDLLEPALPYIVFGWLVGVFGLSVWHLGGWAQLQRLRRKMVKQVDASLHNRLKESAEKLGVNRAVQLLESALVGVPTVVGWLRPVILLPASALTGLTTEQLEAMLAHELAHIKRFDYLVNMLQTVVEILGFYHPAVWWVSHMIRAERENCCDDLAVRILGDRVRYARALTSMEEIRASQAKLAVAASGGSLLNRIRRLVGKDSTEKTSRSWVPAVIGILLIITLVIPTSIALTAHNKTEHSVKFLLDKMLEHRSKVRNLQYVAENNMWRDVAAEQEVIEDQIKRMTERGTPERRLERLKESLSNVPESRYQILKCTVDNEERVKIELTTGTYNSSGKKVPGEDKHIWTWNGVQAIDFTQRSGFPGSARIKDTPTIVTKLAHPWRSFTDGLCRFLEETITAGRHVSINELKDGTCRIAFDYKTSRYVAIVDPSKGYTCTLREDYNEQGQLTSRSTAKYEEVAKGIWFPVSGQRQEYAPDGSLRSKSTVESSQIKINDPAFNESYFDVDLPKGTQVSDYVQGKHYVVGSKRVYDLDEPQTSSAETEDVDPNSWQENFYSIYSLEDGQVLKRIAPPFIPERRGYFLFIQPGRYSPNTPHHVVELYFNWDGKLSIRGSSVGGGIPRLNSILESVIGLSNHEYDIPLELLHADMSGDWIVRKDTPQEELLQALEQMVKDETGRDIDFVKKKVETEVIVAKGKYDFLPLPNITDGKYVLISTKKTDTYTGGGGGSGTLGKFLRWVGNRIEMNIIDETEAEGIELSWRNHDSSDLSRLNHDTEPYNRRLNLLLKNLSQQTGLTFKRNTAAVWKWIVADREPSAESVSGDVLPTTVEPAGSSTQDKPTDDWPRVGSAARSVGSVGTATENPTTSGEDKPHIRVDCIVLEIYGPARFDRETIIAAQNILGETAPRRSGVGSGAVTPTAEELIRLAGGTEHSVGDISVTTGDRQTTAERLDVMIDLLASRGFVKILMNPTLEIVSGGQGRIQSTQKIPMGKLASSSTPQDRYVDVTDYLELTAHVRDDGSVRLLTEGTINRKLPQQDERPSLVKSSFSTHVNIGPGMSLIIGGAQETDKAGTDGQKTQTEVLFVLTPTIVDVAAEQQLGADAQVEDEEPVQPQELKLNELPTGWKLNCVSGFLSSIGHDSAVLKVIPMPARKDESWKEERVKLEIRTFKGKKVENIYIMPGDQYKQVDLQPDEYLLRYTRERGNHPDNFKMRCWEFLIDLSRPGKYELKFTPKLGQAEITGSLGGCNAINFEKVGEGPWIRGFAYQYPSKQYLLDGLPPGKYRLSAVTQRKSSNVFVSQAEVTIGAQGKVTVNIEPPPTGDCSLKGCIFGEQKNYKTPWPDTWPESEGKWYILIRKHGSKEVRRVEAYVALTMDSLYVVRGSNITQLIKDQAQYTIEGVAPGTYTVTAIENPSWAGCTVTRQQSKHVTLKANEEAVLDFDLRDTHAVESER